MKYQIDDQAWRAIFEIRETSVECPDCGGTGRLRVTFHDETTVSVECQNCSRGFQGPTGRVTVYDRGPKAELVTITGIELRRNEPPEYRAAFGPSSSWVIAENRLFDTREEAMECAERLAKEADAEERKKVLQKEKDTESWAWNASYHRKCIKRANEEVKYHEGKLAAANLKAKTAELHADAMKRREKTDDPI